MLCLVLCLGCGAFLTRDSRPENGRTDPDFIEKALGLEDDAIEKVLGLEDDAIEKVLGLPDHSVEGFIESDKSQLRKRRSKKHQLGI